jgi:hypothetical protein
MNARVFQMEYGRLAYKLFVAILVTYADALKFTIVLYPM